VFALLVVCEAGCASDAVHDGSETSVSNKQMTLQVDANGTRDAPREISVASLPDSTCVLTADDSGETTTVLADDEGVVHLWGVPSLIPELYTLECDETDSSGVTRREKYAFDLAAPDAFEAATPRAASKRRRALEPLLDPSGISQEDVIAAGYPPRPDPDSARYEDWLKIVTSRVTMIDAYTLETEFHRGPATATTSPNWSGLALDYPGSAPFANYTDAAGWMVLANFFKNGTGTSITSQWVGLGGAHDSVIIQAGIDATAVGTITAYKPWYEYYPNALVYPAFSMAFNDDTYWEVWECDVNGNYGPSYHGYGCFYWLDRTKSTSYFKVVKKPSGATFTGSSCEAIIERVTDCGSYCNLSSWYGVIWQGFRCYDAGQSTAWDISTDPYLSFTMQNGSSQSLVVPSSSNPNSAGFDWLQSL
jgi:hypothetical protein